MHVGRLGYVPNTSVPSCLFISIELVNHINAVVLMVDHLFVLGFLLDLMSLQS